jgi:uncharacterized membrane protein YdfJ with MMPL/SSD domain
MKSRNLAAEAGRWSAQHRKAAIIGWLAFVIAAVVLGAAVGTKHIAQDSDGTGEAGRAQRVLNGNFPHAAGEQVLIQSRSHTARAPAFRTAVADVVGRLSTLPSVEHVRSPLTASNQGEISRDGHSALVEFDIRGRTAEADKHVGASLAATAAAQRGHPNFLVQQAGDASADKALSKSFSNDFAKARTLSLPITLIILVVAFGALVAAGIPLLLALTAVFATFGLTALPSHLLPLAP